MPDLAFSELEFLKSRKDRPSHVDTAVEKKHADKRTRAADADAEISRYFASQNGAKSHITPSTNEFRQRQAMPGPQTRESQPSFIDLPDRPFLGFGSCGPNSASPVKMVRELDTRQVPSRSQRNTTSPTRTTSYFSWSQSSSGRYRAAREESLYDAASTKTKPRPEGSISTSGIDVPPGSTEPEKTREQRLGIEGSCLLSRSLKHTDIEAAGDRSLDLDLERSHARQASGADKKDLTAPYTKGETLNHRKGDKATTRYLHREPIQQQLQMLNRAGGSIMSEVDQESSHYEESREQGEFQHAVLDPMVASERDLQQSSQIPSLDAALDNLLDQCSSHFIADKARPAAIQDRDEDARSTKGVIQTQIDELEPSHEPGVVQTITSIEALSHQSRHSQVHQWHPYSETAGPNSENSRARSLLEVTGSRKDSIRVNVRLPHVGSPIKAAVGSMNTIYRNTWNEYGQLYDRQLEANSLALKGRTIYEADDHNSSPDQKLQQVNRPKSAANRQLGNTDAALPSKENDISRATVQDNHYEPRASPYSYSYADEEYRSPKFPSPARDSLHDLGSPYVDQRADSSLLDPAINSPWFYGHRHPRLNASTAWRLEESQANQNTDGDLRGFWTANKLY